MILNNVCERFHYMSGYFDDVCSNPEKYNKSELVRYFKALGRILQASYDCEPFDTDDGRF